MATVIIRPFGDKKSSKQGSYGYVPDANYGIRYDALLAKQVKREHDRKKKRKAVMNGTAFQPGGHLYVEPAEEPVTEKVPEVKIVRKAK
jgi:hypothetical protein